MPQTGAPARTIFEGRIPAPDPMMAPDSMRALSPDAHLATDDRIIADGDAAGEARLRGDNDVAADLAVVADVDQIVELGAVTDAGDAERCAVDAGVGADLDIVADDHFADLRELDVVAVFVEREAEAIGADHAAGVEDGVAADAHAVIYSTFACSTLLGPIWTSRPRTHPGPMAIPSPRTTVAADYRRWMDTRFERRMGIEERQGAREEAAWGGVADQRLGGGGIDGGTIRQPATELRPAAGNFGWAANVRSVGCADSSGAAVVSSRSAWPSAETPRERASSCTVHALATIH